MTDTVTVALIVAIPPTLAALLAAWQGRKTAKQGAAIHELVNSRYAILEAELKAANTQIAELLEQLK